MIDAINQSGGLTENADTSNINLAYILKNATSFKIYSKKEIIDMNKKETPCICPSPTNTTCVIENIDNAVTKSSLISINNGTVEELDSLNGIGPSTALKIAEYRTQNGKFETIDDIKKVSGIGDALFAKIKDFITI